MDDGYTKRHGLTDFLPYRVAYAGLPCLFHPSTRTAKGRKPRRTRKARASGTDSTTTLRSTRVPDAGGNWAFEWWLGLIDDLSPVLSLPVAVTEMGTRRLHVNRKEQSKFNLN